MLKFVFRFAGFWIVAAALVAATVDGAKSIAASAVVLTPLAESWAALAALGSSQANGEASNAAALPFADALPWLATLPTAPVLAVLGFILLAIGRKRRPAVLGHEFAA